MEGEFKKFPDRVVIESPLGASTPEGFVNNFRFLLWCCRAVWLKEGVYAIGSHMLNPWYMDDREEAERAAGIANPWTWSGDPHWFFTDIGVSKGMLSAQVRCATKDITYGLFKLAKYTPGCWLGYERGEWPPHTPGFELVRV